MLNLDYLKQITNGDLEQIKEMLAIFFQVTHEDLENLQKAINNEQNSLVASTAHRIKGATIIIGAIQLSNLASELEYYGTKPEPERYEAMYDKIQISLNKLQAYCDDLSVWYMDQTE